MEEHDVLACVGADEDAVEGSSLSECSTCGAAIWISPSGRNMIEEKNLVAVCMSCLPVDGVFAPVQPEQMVEMMRYFLMNNAEGRRN